MGSVKNFIHNLNKQEIKLILKSNFFILQDGSNFSYDTLLHYNYSQKLITKSIFKHNLKTNFFSTLKIKFPCFILYTNEQKFLNNYFFNLLFDTSFITSLIIKNFNLIFYKLDFLSKNFFDSLFLFYTFFSILSFYQYGLVTCVDLFTKKSVKAD